MKRYRFYLFASLLMTLMSCDRDDSLLNYNASVIVSVPRCYSTSATVALFAKDVQSLGVFTVGVCYSTSENPTVQDTHNEIEVNSDSLIIPNLTLNLNLTDLTRGTGYYIRGYIKIGNDTYYSEQVQFETPYNTFNITVSDDYVPEGQEFWIVLSSNSTTILTQKIENNRTYSFSENIPDLADFHLMRLSYSNNRYGLSIVSHADIVPDDFYLDNTGTLTPNNGQTIVTISDLADILRWGIACTKWSISTTNPSSKSLTNYLTKEPDDLFIYYLPSDGSAPRYKYINGVSYSSSYTYTMADLTAMTSYSDITLPSNNYFNYYLAGYNIDYYTDYIRLNGHAYSSGYNGTFRLYYPQSIRSNLYFYASYNNGNQQSVYMKYGSLPTTYFTDFPNITINNLSDFSNAVSGISNYADYELMEHIGYYGSQPYYIYWYYYNKPQGSVSAPIPDIPDEITEKTGDINISSLTLVNVAYIDIVNSQVTSYENYIDLSVKQSKRFYDIISEHRIYYLSPGKKSDILMNDIDQVDLKDNPYNTP